MRLRNLHLQSIVRLRRGQGESEADFIPIVTWRQLAETCANYLRKGRLTAVEGRIQVRNYENNEGKRVYVTEVIADNVRFLESNQVMAAERVKKSGSMAENTWRRLVKVEAKATIAADNGETIAAAQ